MSESEVMRTLILCTVCAPGWVKGAGINTVICTRTPDGSAKCGVCGHPVRYNPQES